MALLARLLIIVVTLAPLGVARQAEQPSLFERVARLMLRRYHDEEFRERTLPGLIERYRERAEAARSDREARAVIFEMLAECPTSHLAILSAAGARHAMNEMTGRTALTLGFQLGAVDGSYFAMRILAGGAAERAGLKRGDRVTHIDGVPTAQSARVSGAGS